MNSELMTKKANSDLAELLSDLQTGIDQTLYIIISCQAAKAKTLQHQSKSMIREKGGTTLVSPVDIAECEGFFVDEKLCCIYLNVLSVLHAVGLTAAIKKHLAQGHISANIMAGFYHDHIFVPEKDSMKAPELLSRMP